jgi:holo-[acyl-carrier protein] synthase
MEILGIGTDIIEIERIARVVQDHPRFKTRIYTKAELDYCLGKKSCHAHLAARFAAKEAVAKAIGQSLSWQDVEIANGDHGKPVVKLSGKAKRLTKSKRILLTMSHSENYATATAILVVSSEF